MTDRYEELAGDDNVTPLPAVEAEPPELTPLLPTIGNVANPRHIFMVDGDKLLLLIDDSEFAETHARQLDALATFLGIDASRIMFLRGVRELITFSTPSDDEEPLC